MLGTSGISSPNAAPSPWSFAAQMIENEELLDVVDELHEMRKHAAVRWAIGGVHRLGKNDWLERISLRRSSAAHCRNTGNQPQPCVQGWRL